HPMTCFDIQVEVQGVKHTVGIIYKTNTTKAPDASLFELFINKIDDVQQLQQQTKSIQEIDQKLVALDTNITLDSAKDIRMHINDLLNQHASHIWKWEIIDTYTENQNSIKYTVRITYMHLNDVDAKELHAK